MEDERDAEDAIRALDRFEYGRTGRRLRVEWTKGRILNIILKVIIRTDLVMECKF